MAFCENNFGYGIVLSPSCKTKKKTEIVRHLLTALYFFSWPGQPTKIQFQITCSCRPPKQKNTDTERLNQKKKLCTFQVRNSQDQRHDPPESLYTTFLAPIKDGPSNLWGAGVTTPYNWSYGTLLLTGDGAHLVFSSFIFSWCSLLDWQSTRRNATTTSAKKNIEVGQSKYSENGPILGSDDSSTWIRINGLWLYPT